MSRTIAAIATPLGAGSIAVIRISGDDAVRIADKVFSRDLTKVPSHTVHYGFAVNDRGERIDEVLATVMLAPRSFSAEDTVEISTHGGATAANRVLDALIKAGARMAQPGEFTKRAFLNGRIDLSQAEAVIDIINSKNELAQRNALSQLEGSLSKRIRTLRDRLLNTAARMQVIIDYPDEDLEDIDAPEVEEICRECAKEAQKLLAGADSGRILKNGIRTAIAGKPNVGKSSLLNFLSRSDRAIVTDIAGTTRDVIEENINLDGIPLVLIDTAGIRDTEDAVEKIGVEKSRQSISEADLVIVMLDGSTWLTDEDREVLHETRDKKRIILINKTDLGQSKYTTAVKAKAKDAAVIEVSALTGAGMEKLSERIKEMYSLGALQTGQGALITNMRHKSALTQAHKSLLSAADALAAGMPTDIASIDINAAISALGEITGETVSEDIVNTIFHSFCVGK
ncbi:MAG: tRNA uridine-5-carboxymethylaminomethyl(34) synthesis GTPase MnmE [Clostridiales bacterium]|nr:tRNA uridine-5-carboxymethylaminomethyl(34) synthesis GTPase MnmE [Clostridiales bacterium]